VVVRDKRNGIRRGAEGDDGNIWNVAWREGGVEEESYDRGLVSETTTGDLEDGGGGRDTGISIDSLSH